MASTDEDIPALPQDRTGYWILRGMAAAFSIPGLILCSAFIGFAGLAKDAGITIGQSVFMVATIWALPGKVVLIGAIMAGNSLVAAAFAVALSSIRLMPMVVSIVPELRGPATRPWVLYLVSHCVAVTSWVIALERFKDVPRTMRTSFYGGLGFTLISLNMVVVAVVYTIAATLPPALAAALLLLTPMYFLTSLWGSARELAGNVAMVLGLLLGPVASVLVPGFELLAAGTVGGSLAYLWHRWSRTRRAGR